MLGMIIGVAAVITMVALGTGAQSSIEAQIQSAGTNMVMVSAGNFMQGGVRLGQGNASTLVPEDAAAIAQLPGVQYVAAGSNTRGQIIAGQPELEHAGAGHRRRHAADPVVAGEGGGVFHAAGRVHRLEGRRARQRDARSAVRAGDEPDRRRHPDREPALHHRRRDGRARASRGWARIRTIRSSCRTRP